MRADVGDIDAAVLLAEINAHRQRPGVFARYFELVFALRAERHEAAAGLLREIAAMARETPSLEVKPLSQDAMGGDAARYARLLNAGEKAEMVAAPDLSYWNGFDARVAIALEMLDETDAALADEVRALVCEVVASMPADPVNSFGGVSSLTLWGAVVLTLDRHQTTLDIMESLVHEGAHLLLFGYAADEPLVTNPAGERFGSPLRQEPRPMDGVFHATFVCARLHYLYRRLEAKNLAGLSVDRSLIDQRLDTFARRFRDGADVIAEHGRLSGTGERIMRATTDYMTDVAA